MPTRVEIVKLAVEKLLDIFQMSEQRADPPPPPAEPEPPILQRANKLALT